MTSPSAPFDGAFLVRIEGLRRVFRGGLGGRQAVSGRLTGRPGGEVEFLRHRPYFPGDDLRRCDWKAYQRTGKPFLREFAREEILAVRVVLDASASMQARVREGDPASFYTARRLALLFMGVLREDEEPIEVAAVSAEGEQRMSLQGRRFGEMIAFLRGLEAKGKSGGVTSAISAWQRRLPGVTFYISDFYPEAEALVSGETPRFIRPGGLERLVFIRVQPDWNVPEGHAVLSDSETGERDEALLGGDARKVLLEGERRLESLFRRWTAETGGTYLSAVAGGDEFEVAMRLFGRLAPSLARR